MRQSHAACTTGCQSLLLTFSNPHPAGYPPCFHLLLWRPQVGSALSPEALRQRGASGSCSHAYHPATPVLSTPGRHRYSGQQLQGSQVSTLSSTPATAGTAGLGVQEMGAGQLQELLGSGGSLEIVAGSRQALAMYAGNEIEAARLPRDWQRLHKDRDLRVGLGLSLNRAGARCWQQTVDSMFAF